MTGQAAEASAPQARRHRDRDQRDQPIAKTLSVARWTRPLRPKPTHAHQVLHAPTPPMNLSTCQLQRPIPAIPGWGILVITTGEFP